MIIGYLGPWGYSTHIVCTLALPKRKVLYGPGIPSKGDPSIVP